MMLLGEDEASEILKNLTPKEVQHLGGAMYSVEGLDQDTVNKVLDEFLAIIKEQTSLGLGAGNYIQNVLNKALGQDRAQSILGRITPSESNNAIEILEWMDSRAIAELIQDEHPQIIALIISYLEPAQGSDVLVMLDEKIQPEIVKRIATIQTVQPDALKDLELVMQKKFAAHTSLRASQVGGVKAAAQIMNFMKGEDAQKILALAGENKLCGNCAAFDISKEMVACGGANSEGTVGYCKMHDFSCTAEKTCLTYAHGGPKK